MDRNADKKLARTIGRVARQAREARRLTQADVAERIGISAEFYARVERGNALPSVQTLGSISALLNVKVDMLLGRIKGQRAPAATEKPGEHTSEDPPQLRRVARRLRKAQPETIRAVSRLLRELDRKR